MTQMSPDFVATARKLAPLFERQALENERAGTLTEPVVAALRDSGLFWAMIPKELGGGGCNTLDLIALIEEVSRADGSTGWTLMANSTGTSVAAAFLGDEAIAAMFGKEKPITAGMLAPNGSAVVVDGGFRGKGKYSFGSGAPHSNWMIGGMSVLENGKPRLLPNGQPEMLVCFVPKEKAKMLGNWNVMGLCGTASLDYELPEQFVPTAFTMERTSLKPRRGGAHFRFGVVGLGSAGHSAVALGLTRRALEEIAKIARGKKRPGYPSVIADHPVFREKFATHEAEFQATRAFTFQVYEDAEETLASGRDLTPLQRQRFRQVAVWSHRVGAEIVQFCHLWGGSDALRIPSALGLAMRDMHVATQHMFVDPIHLVDSGPLLLETWAKGGA